MDSGPITLSAEELVLFWVLTIGIGIVVLGTVIEFVYGMVSTFIHIWRNRGQY